jgi:hypothetical protein
MNVTEPVAARAGDIRAIVFDPLAIKQIFFRGGCNRFDDDIALVRAVGRLLKRKRRRAFRLCFP